MSGIARRVTVGSHLRQNLRPGADIACRSGNVSTPRQPFQNHFARGNEGDGPVSSTALNTKGQYGPRSHSGRRIVGRHGNLQLECGTIVDRVRPPLRYSQTKIGAGNVPSVTDVVTDVSVTDVCHRRCHRRWRMQSWRVSRAPKSDGTRRTREARSLGGAGLGGGGLCN